MHVHPLLFKFVLSHFSKFVLSYFALNVLTHILHTFFLSLATGRPCPDVEGRRHHGRDEP